MRKKITRYMSIIAIIVGICTAAIVLVLYPAVLLKWIDVAVFTVFIALSILCIVRHIRGAVLILACWCTLGAVNVILRLYPFAPEEYIGFVTYALPAAETVCALLTGLWLIRLLKEKVV